MPVTIERHSAASRFRIRYADGEISTNLSLQARLRDFGIALPDVPETEELSPGDYFAAVADAIRGQPRWEVLRDDLVLWLFSFSKFLMYRDLGPENWPDGHRLEDNTLIRAILRDGFTAEPPLCGEDERIDEVIRPIDMAHVLDADSSQALVIEEIRRGRNLVVQGPPGTGKSQTIVNMIAAAVKAGKSVLFVAEKMAALKVVRSRLDSIKLGDTCLGDICLEWHSNKTNKRNVLRDLKHTLDLGQRAVPDVEGLCATLETCRRRLDAHLAIIHTPIEPAGVTPYQVVGKLVRLAQPGWSTQTSRWRTPLSGLAHGSGRRNPFWTISPGRSPRSVFPTSTRGAASS